MKSLLVRTIAAAVTMAPMFSWASGMEIVDATPLETAAARTSLDRIVNYFKSIGANVDPSFKVIFKDEVLLPGSDTSVFGYFDTDTKEIHILHFESPQQSDRRPWQQAWNNEIAESFLVHEMTHMVATSYMGDDFKRISHAWHEALAYTVQFQMMSPSLREAIAAASERPQPFSGQDMINSFIYEADPDAFGYRASLSIPIWGGDAFLKKLMDGEIAGTQKNF